MPWPILRVDILTSIRNKMRPSISSIMAPRKNTTIADDILKLANSLKNSETITRQITNAAATNILIDQFAKRIRVQRAVISV